ncbi:MAG: hypothetical protein HY909_03295 [Deltaproteobacteria bacterium]|nr:hypothetical protein [Deltaproteobacteria bacterium]
MTVGPPPDAAEVGPDLGVTDAGSPGEVPAMDAPPEEEAPLPGRQCQRASDCPRGSGSVLCELGYCVLLNNGEFRLCETASAYVRVTDNPAHCGRCGNACGPLEYCSGRACVPCPAGSGRCEVSGFRCGVNLRTDPSNCGTCARRCGPEEQCAGGVCAACPAGFGRCRSGTCMFDLQRDRRNCGACDRECREGEGCVAGVCGPCPAGTALCGTGNCQDLQTSPTHCGRCWNACADGSPCVGGVCQACPAGSGRCGGTTCRDLSADPDHCGSCETRCDRLRTARVLGIACERGRCVATACAPGTASCGGSPCDTALAVSEAHCGACGRACGRDQRCVLGVCTTLPIRQRSPISATSVTSRRPTFWWFLSPGVTGARVQLCAARDCAVVEATWDAVGDHLRAPTELTEGRHFWRLFGRRGEAVDATPGLTWEFEVPPTPQGIRGFGGPDAVGDVNGDGLGDLVTREGISYGTPTGFVPPPRARFVPPSSWTSYSATWRVSATGDLDGDGLGDYAHWLWEVFGAPDVHLRRSAGLVLSTAEPTALLWELTPQSAWAWGDVRGEGRTQFFTLRPDVPGPSSLVTSSWSPSLTMTTTPYPDCGFFSADLRFEAADYDGDGYDDLRARYGGSASSTLRGGPMGLGPQVCAP